MNGTLVFKVKTTDQLEPEDIAGLTRLFRVVFGKPCPADLFHRKFSHTCLGRSVHSMMFLGGELIGAFSSIPVRYNFFGRTLLFAATADLMVAPEHRGNIARVIRLADGLYQALAREGVAFVFCCLRDEIFQLHRAISRWRAVGKVQYYIAPVRLPYLGPLSAIVSTMLRTWNRMSQVEHSALPAGFAVEKLNDAAFQEYRYRIFPSAYITLALPDGASAIYVRDMYYPVEKIPKNIRLGLLLDVYPLTRENFDSAVREIRQREPDLTVLAYQGFLPFTPLEMLRVPERFEKQAWTLGGKILAPDLVDDRIFDIRCWNVNLSNGDLV